MEKRSQGILLKLQAAEMKTEIGADAPQSDHEFIRILQEGEAEGNLDKIYQFVSACERGNGLLRNSVVIDLVRQAYEQSPERTMQILAGKRHLERCVFLSACSEEMKIMFIRMGASGNMLFLYECLRQLLRTESHSLEKVEAVVSGISMLSEGDETLWERWIRTEEYNKNWQSLLGRILPELGSDALLLFAKTIRMDFPENQYAQISNSLSQMNAKKMERVQHACASILYSRWKEYLQALREKKSALRGVLMSGYQELIFQSLRYVCRDQAVWEREVMDCLSLFEEDMYSWYTNVVELSAVFFVHMSQLFLLLHAGADLGVYPGKKLSRMLEKAEQQMEVQEYLWKNDGQESLKSIRQLIETILVPDPGSS